MTTTSYSYTGSAVTVNISTTATYYIALWGGAGGAGRYNNGPTSGAGALVYISLQLFAGDVLTLEVGQGGGPGKSSPAEGGVGGWPDGGFGGRGDVQCGGGGGSSRLWVNGVLVAVAGAGAGASGYSTGGIGGAGGYPKGEDCSVTTGGTGGTQTAGGYDASDPSSVPKTGAYLQGGRGTTAVNRFTNTTDDGAGGGGGYYGGGGGGGDGRSGGGGSSWADSARCLTINYLNGTRATPSTLLSWYVAGVAEGKASTNTNTAQAGGDGLIVVSDTPASGSVDLAKVAAYAPMASLKNGVSKIAGYGVLSPPEDSVSVSKATGYVVTLPGIPLIRIPKITGYAVLENNAPVDNEQMLSKATGYAILFDDPEGYSYVTKTTGYAVLRGDFRISKFVNYAVMEDPTPRFIDLSKTASYVALGSTHLRTTKVTAYVVQNATPRPEILVSKETGYAVVMPLNPRVYVPRIVAETITSGAGSVRVSRMIAETITTSGGAARLSLNVAEVVTSGDLEIRCSRIVAEVLCAVPEEPHMIDPATHIFPSQAQLPGLTFNVKKAPSFSTRVAGNTSGREVRNAFWDDPRWDFEMSYELLRDYPVHQVESELKKIAGFFMQRRGKFEAWLYRDVDDHVANNLQAITDGVTLTFPLRRDFGGFLERIGQISTEGSPTFWFRMSESGDGEAYTVPVTPGPYTITATNAALFRDNIKVTLDDGTPLEEVAVAPAAMQYSVNSVTGVYTFNAAQQGADVRLYYELNIAEGDYEILMPNKIVFNSAPVAGLELWGAFEFYFVCRFDEDAHEYEKFMDKLWELQQCTFKSIIQ